MTVKELYETIGADYEGALKIMMMDKLIDRFIQKLPEDPSCPNLMKAAETMDPTALFESAHAMKGVYANLCLIDLSRQASEICEEFRPGNARTMSDEEVKTRLSNIKSQYNSTMSAIKQYMAQ